MQDIKQQELSKDFIEKFDNKFYQIARLADRGDDEGYGKGLARLQTEIEEYLLKTVSLAVEQEKAKTIQQLKDICNKCKTERGLARAIGNLINNK